jgi:glycosyltransferase involved in cell wall biosynthesis
VTTVSYDVSVVTSGHDVADARLHRIVAAAVRGGLTVEVLGTGVAAAGPAGCAVRTWPRAGFARRSMRALTLPWRARGAVLLTLDPDAAVGAEPARRVRNRVLVVDVHEDYAALLRDRPWAGGLRGRLAGPLARLATAVAGRADLTVVADEHLPPPESACRRRLVVRNLPDLRLMGSAASPVAGDGHGLRAVYVGDVRRSRGLASMVEAVAVAPGWTLDIVGPVSRDDAGWLRERLTRTDVNGRVRLHGRQPPEQAWQIAAGASVGLALLDDTPAFRAAVPTKVYEYLAAGMAVVASPLPRVVTLLSDSGGGTVVDGAAEAGALLRRWETDGGAQLAALQDAARRWSAGHLGGETPYDVLARELRALVLERDD